MLQDRANTLCARMPAGFEAALVQTHDNRFYLLDFDSHDAGLILVLPDEMVYIIDSRYIEVAQVSVTTARVVLETNALEQAAQLLRERGVKKLYVENGISVAQLDRNRAALQDLELDAGPTLSDTLLAMRQIKDEDEIARMREAQRITDACFAHIQPFIREGAREVDIMLEMEHFMRANGAEGLAFDTICVAGANSSRPHGVPGENRVKAGDFVTLDFGAKYKGYCADMTRTVCVGFISEEQQTVYDTVLRAHLAGIDAAKDGARCADVDKVARDIIYGAGYEGYFGHGLGHAVGIDVHEDPRFNTVCQTVAKAGMMMTVEPGIYLPGRFGCRIEDTCLITQDGCEPLPKSDKTLIIL